MPARRGARLSDHLRRGDQQRCARATEAAGSAAPQQRPLGREIQCAQHDAGDRADAQGRADHGVTSNDSRGTAIGSGGLGHGENRIGDEAQGRAPQLARRALYWGLGSFPAGAFSGSLAGAVSAFSGFSESPVDAFAGVSSSRKGA